MFSLEGRKQVYEDAAEPCTAAYPAIALWFGVPPTHAFPGTLQKTTLVTHVF